MCFHFYLTGYGCFHNDWKCVKCGKKQFQEWYPEMFCFLSLVLNRVRKWEEGMKIEDFPRDVRKNQHAIKAFQNSKGKYLPWVRDE